jgi:iron only hydrogenase large subunit-like protein
MACPGGCVAGPGTNLPVDKAAKFVQKYASEAKAVSPMDSAYRNEGHKLD